MYDYVCMEPRQPLFVTGSESYQKFVLNRYGIVHFYRCNTCSQPRLAIPDGCVDMVFCCDKVEPEAYICGTVLKAEQVLTRSNTYYFGIRFMPGYNPVLGETDVMEYLVGAKIPFETLVHDERMLEGIWSAEDFYTQIKVFMNSYMKIFRRICPFENSNLLVTHSLNRMFESGGIIRLEQLAEETGYSERYLNKCFHRETGLSPKQFAKIIRFQKSVTALNDSGEISLTEIAANAGYFDQAHFVHDFKAYTGLTPKRYRDCLNYNEFYKKLEIVSF